MATHEKTYEDFAMQGKVLLELARREAAVIDALEIASRQEWVARLLERIDSDAFKVLVLGDFRHGKSTFINALLGRRVLPSFAWPTTAIVNEVKYAERERALLYPLPENGSAPEPIPIAVADLERYVTIDNDPSKASPYEKAEVYWPLELCRNRVEIIDSPGLNEDPERTRITTTYLTLADAVILVLDAQSFLGQNEQKFVELHLQPQGYDNVFFVCNKINLIDDDEREETIRRHRQRAARVLADEGRLFFLDARGALKARLAGDDQALDGSGLPVVERYLQRFLIESRGRAKILGPARELRETLRVIRETIHDRERMYDTDLDELRDRYEQAQEPLARLERKRDLIVSMMQSHLLETRCEVEEEARRLFDRVADTCADWVREIELEHRPSSLNPFGASAWEQACKELSEKLNHRMQVEVANWLSSDLQELLERRAASLEQRIGDDLRGFVERIDEVRFDLQGLGERDREVDQPSDLQRLLSAAAGLALLDIGCAYTGARFGFKEMAKGVLPQLAIGAVALAVTANPFVLVSVLLARPLIKAVKDGKRQEQRIRDEVAGETQKELRARASDDAGKLARDVAQRLDTVRNSVSTVLGNEIENVRRQAEAVLAEKTQGEAQVTQAREKLRDLTAEINDIHSGLDKLIHEVAL